MVEVPLFTVKINNSLQRRPLTSSTIPLSLKNLRIQVTGMLMKICLLCICFHHFCWDECAFNNSPLAIHLREKSLNNSHCFFVRFHKDRTSLPVRSFISRESRLYGRNMLSADFLQISFFSQSAGFYVITWKIIIYEII